MGVNELVVVSHVNCSGKRWSYAVGRDEINVGVSFMLIVHVKHLQVLSTYTKALTLIMEVGSEYKDQ